MEALSDIPLVHQTCDYFCSLDSFQQSFYNKNSFSLISQGLPTNSMGNICCQQQTKPFSQRNNQPPPARKVPNNPTQSSENTNNENNHFKQRIAGQLKNKQPSSPDMFSSQNSTLSKHGPENYQSIKYLGKGTFGDVVLAEDKENGRQYAMKIIQKKKIKQINLLQSEKIKKINQCELFVRIRETFQNQSKIYIVMEYLPRGDVYFYLKKKACDFKQDIIKILVSQIISGIQFLHSHDIIYRQLKPQNILVTNDGHIKLGDYGLSKIIVEQKNPSSTFVGTLQYTAPQAISGSYGKKADSWAIGVLMFQLKFEKNLFEAENETNDKVESKIQSINIQEILNNLVDKVGYNFRDVMIKLLQRDPEKRISIDDLKKHPFFEGIIWQDIPLRKNPPPLRQILESDHIKFKDPKNETELPHRKRIENKIREFKTKLYQFRDE